MVVQTSKSKPSVIKSKFKEHGPCEKCSSSDAVGWYSDGHGVCFSCGHYYNHNGKFTEEKLLDKLEPVNKKITPLTDVYRAIPKRGLNEESVAKFQIDICMDKTSFVGHRYPFFKNGEHVANQIRKRGVKEFIWEGDTHGIELFGQQLFQPGSANAVTICEGALDAPAAWQLLGSRYPVVSVVSAASALEQCKCNYEWLDSFEEIVICFDNDSPKERNDGSSYRPGQEAAKKVAELFKPGKCRILTLDHGKDACDYTSTGVEPKLFVHEWWKAPRYRPDGLKVGKDMLDEIINRPSSFAIPYPWEPLNKKTYGIRLSEAVLFMADTGIGKTSVFKELEHAILKNEEVRNKGYGVGFLHLEEPNFDTALGILSIEKNKPFHLPDVPRTVEELEDAFNNTINSDRAIFYDHFGSNDIDEIVAKVRYMSVMGCKYIFIDHLSIIVSDQSGDERKQLDEISTKLKTLTMELNIAVFCIIHTNRQGEARGSAGPEKVANIHISLHRDKKDSDPWRRNVLKLTIEKNRFSGRTGPCLWLFYNEVTGRLDELDDVAITKYEEGLSINDADMPF